MQTLTRIIHTLCTLIALLNAVCLQGMWRVPALNLCSFITVMQPEKQIKDPEAKKYNQKILSNEEKSNCFICMDMYKNMLKVPCDNQHPARMCLTCYNKLLTTKDSCPFCRDLLKK